MPDNFIAKRPAGPAEIAWLSEILCLDDLEPHIAGVLFTIPCTIYKVAAETDIISEGETGREVYVLYRGKASVYRTSGSGMVKAGTLLAGDFFGEIAFLIGIKRSATVRADTECEVFMFDAGAFAELIKQFPCLLTRVRDTAARRIAKMFEE
ncbi:MAG: cyclic nucleotide-binding domain-containing protein [Elusimicrobiaceae bacterium]|jgi:CRP-like cAMP-binding protein